MSTIARTVKLFVDRALSPAALSAQLAARARAERDRVVAAGQAPPAWRTFVDGREGANEDTVRQSILYQFNLLPQAIGFALGYCQGRSPVGDRGTYRRSWTVYIAGKKFDGDLSTIPAGSTVMISNPQPYARKIDAGGMKMSVPPGIIEAARQVTQRAFPSMSVQRIFTNIAGGTDKYGKPVPYILKGSSRRKDRQAGAEMTYPALLISGRL
jgi:hypothetical protein